MYDHILKSHFTTTNTNESMYNIQQSLLLPQTPITSIDHWPTLNSLEVISAEWECTNLEPLAVTAPTLCPPNPATGAITAYAVGVIQGNTITSSPPNPGYRFSQSRVILREAQSTALYPNKRFHSHCIVDLTFQVNIFWELLHNLVI